MSQNSEEKKSKVVSFNLPVEVYNELIKQKRHTVFCRDVITAALGRCPTCGGEVDGLTKNARKAAPSRTK